MRCVVDDIARLNNTRSATLAELTPQKIELLLECNPHFELEHFESLDGERFKCYYLHVDGKIIAYVWAGNGLIPAQHNSNGHPWTGMAIELDQESVYLFAAYVRRENRGQRAYQSLLQSIASELLPTQYKNFLLTTDRRNKSAIKAVNRMGFSACGRTRFVSYAGFKYARYKFDESMAGNIVAPYCGDARRL